MSKITNTSPSVLAPAPPTYPHTPTHLYTNDPLDPTIRTIYPTHRPTCTHSSSSIHHHPPVSTYRPMYPPTLLWSPTVRSVITEPPAPTNLPAPADPPAPSASPGTTHPPTHQHQPTHRHPRIQLAHLTQPGPHVPSSFYCASSCYVEKHNDYISPQIGGTIYNTITNFQGINGTSLNKYISKLTIPTRRLTALKA